MEIDQPIGYVNANCSVFTELNELNRTRQKEDKLNSIITYCLALENIDI